MTGLQVSALVVLGILAAAAQHSHIAPGLLIRRTRSTVTGYSWSNPHVTMGLEVKDASGKIEKWNVGGPSVMHSRKNTRNSH